MYGIVRRVLFSIDAENAHDFALRALEKTQDTPWAWLYRQRRVEDPIVLAGIRFPNRVGLAAGMDKEARCVSAFETMGFGFVELGTVTPLGQSGNKKPRLFHLASPPGTILNRMGFNNPGLEVFLANLALYPKGKKGMVIGINIGKNASTPIERAADDYVKGLEGVYAAAGYVTINLSSPNTPNLRSLQAPQALDALLETLSCRREGLALQHGGKRVPLFLKVSPDLDPQEVAQIAFCVQKNKIDGVVATNTTLALESQEREEGEGGLSGAAVREKSNRVIRELRKHLGPRFPIIGVGGVLTAQDARDKIEAGADAIQIYTGLIYYGPRSVPELAKTLKYSCPSGTSSHFFL